MIKLYDFKSSPNCQRVKMVLAEKNLPYEIVSGRSARARTKDAGLSETQSVRQSPGADRRRHRALRVLYHQ